MDIQSYFTNPVSTAHKKYEALRAFYVDKKTAPEVAQQFGYTASSLYSLTRDFKKSIKQKNSENLFFVEHKAGRKPQTARDEIRDSIVELRKQYLSVQDIKSILDSKNIQISEKQIYNIIHAEGFARLPRRSRHVREKVHTVSKIEAPKSELLSEDNEEFNTQNAGVLAFLPIIKAYEIDKAIESSSYPETKSLPRLSSILAILALKLSNFRRYTADDLWCMDRGLGLFAGLNVLPKASWYTSYSHSVTREMNLSFLRQLHLLWEKHGLLSDTAHLDFTTIPYWGEEAHLENNWSGTRHHALSSILAAIAHDADSGILTYGDTSVRHENESDVVLEFLDFYKKDGENNIKYIVFDSKFTTYANLRKLDDQDVKFITIRRRGKTIVKEIEALPPAQWKTVRVQTSHGKTRQLKVMEKTFVLKGYDKEMRQIAITGHGKIKPALIITNDFDLPQSDIIRKYAKRWLVEKAISEQAHFFHLNKLSSSMVIKVDFDLTMTILAYNLYCILARDLPGFTNCTAQSLYEKFIYNSGEIKIKNDKISVSLRKKRHLPTLLTSLNKYSTQTMQWLHNRVLEFEPASSS